MTSSTAVVLDTRPPVLTVLADPTVTPPQAWEVQVTSTEDIGTASAVWCDQLGDRLALGVEHLDARRLRVLVPTVAVLGGPATLLLTVGDQVGNTTTHLAPVLVRREEGFTVSLTLGSAYQVDAEITSAYDTALAVGSAYQTQVTVSSAYETDLSLTAGGS